MQSSNQWTPPSSSRRRYIGGGAQEATIELLHFQGDYFDPTSEPLRSQVLARLEPLGVAPDQCGIERLEQNGGMNKGMWIVHGMSRPGTLVLKLVETQRKHEGLPTDVENFTSVIQRRPNVVNDHALTFPIKIFHCVGPDDVRRHDLVVMRRAPGHGFDKVLAVKCHLGRVESLMKDMEALGRLIAQIHNVYGMQHGDLQPSNIFYEEAHDWFTLIDCGSMGPQPYACDDDLQHLIRGIALITPHMGKDFQADVKRCLETSYAQELGRLDN
jgi:hypothetical protein